MLKRYCLIVVVGCVITMACEQPLTEDHACRLAEERFESKAAAAGLPLDRFDSECVGFVSKQREGVAEIRLRALDSERLPYLGGKGDESSMLFRLERFDQGWMVKNTDPPLSILDIVADRKKQRGTMADLRSIGTAIEEYSIDNNFYPRASSIEELEQFVSPTYIRGLPREDGWNTEFYVNATRGEYVIGSCGKGATSCYSLDVTGFGKTNRFSDDIVFSNGAFVQWPEGPQY